ncbi:MAG: tryptophan-rich sensory protein [Clostridia bacterium]|nr:tryptophan-rich sensory protein [Clostridia bacterium]
MKIKPIWVILISVAIAEGVGFLSGLLSGNIGAVYQQLQQPPLAPPGWLFPIAWGILYALMGIAAGLIWLNNGDMLARRNALNLYAIQLFVNFTWSIIFFRFMAFGAGVAVVLLLDVLVLLTLLRFWKISRPAGILLIPYLLWLLYATYLTIGIAVLN